MNTKTKATLCFLFFGALASILDWILVNTIKIEGLWYRSFEYWVTPTYANFTVASVLTVLAILAGGIYSMRRGWIQPLRASFSRKLYVAAILVLAHPTIFWVGSNMKLYPGSSIFSMILLSLCVSFALWIVSGSWSTPKTFLVLLCCLVGPSIAPALGIADPGKLVYPSTLPLIAALCGFWLASSSKGQNKRTDVLVTYNAQSTSK